MEQRLGHATPAFYVRNRIFARLQEDGEHISIASPRTEREALLDQYPDVLSVADHCANHVYVLLNLHAANPSLVQTHLESAWRLMTPKRAIALFDTAA